MANVKVDARYRDLGHLPYHNDNVLMMFDELFRKKSSQIKAERQQEVRENLVRAAQDSRNGAAWNVRSVVVVGQKAIVNG